MRVLRTDSQTSNEQKEGVQLDVMYAAAPGWKWACFIAENTVQFGPRQGLLP